MKKIIFLGDSITDDSHCFLENPLGNGYVNMVAEKLNDSDGGRKKYDIMNRGHDGFTIHELQAGSVGGGRFTASKFRIEEIESLTSTDWESNINMTVDVNEEGVSTSLKQFTKTGGYNALTK